MDTTKHRRDFIHTEACGCTVIFIAASGYKTSRMLPGKGCTSHTHINQFQARTDLVARGRDALAVAAHNAGKKVHRP